ncbi:hypothetical protein ERJ75_000357200 [Trypanosoma vivax]|uniref:Uncharacterized protein n=1 Tax=Trypanosoma vivax (strain Y486) TaxID=1055687 RepID=F9WQ17_TRYVY|nr:hypothetical protein TRVL_04276 [Trypanosoma vivax]KAH8617629.1 hypothetical protein ERJ75_000357200 [Trypanosoma vivax]CCD19645.1 hypothetical protein, conserved [Trypanosoma vivax Y486]|eukprot:CCD19645.1 hypothetical protein, conserved [Trypanosoma vivax Y486]
MKGELPRTWRTENWNSKATLDLSCAQLRGMKLTFDEKFPRCATFDAKASAAAIAKKKTYVAVKSSEASTAAGAGSLRRTAATESSPFQSPSFPLSESPLSTVLSTGATERSVAALVDGVDRLNEREKEAAVPVENILHTQTMMQSCARSSGALAPRSTAQFSVRSLESSNGSTYLSARGVGRERSPLLVECNGRLGTNVQQSLSLGCSDGGSLVFGVSRGFCAPTASPRRELKTGANKQRNTHAKNCGLPSGVPLARRSVGSITTAPARCLSSRTVAPIGKNFTVSHASSSVAAATEVLCRSDGSTRNQHPLVAADTVANCSLSSCAVAAVSSRYPTSYIRTSGTEGLLSQVGTTAGKRCSTATEGAAAVGRCCSRACSPTFLSGRCLHVEVDSSANAADGRVLIVSERKGTASAGASPRTDLPNSQLMTDAVLRANVHSSTMGDGCSTLQLPKTSEDILNALGGQVHGNDEICLEHAKVATLRCRPSLSENVGSDDDSFHSNNRESSAEVSLEKNTGDVHRLSLVEKCSTLSGDSGTAVRAPVASAAPDLMPHTKEPVVASELDVKLDEAVDKACFASVQCYVGAPVGSSGQKPFIRNSVRGDLSSRLQLNVMPSLATLRDSVFLAALQPSLNLRESRAGRRGVGEKVRSFSSDSCIGVSRQGSTAAKVVSASGDRSAMVSVSRVQRAGLQPIIPASQSSRVSDSSIVRRTVPLTSVDVKSRGGDKMLPSSVLTKVEVATSGPQTRCAGDLSRTPLRSTGFGSGKKSMDGRCKSSSSFPKDQHGLKSSERPLRVHGGPLTRERPLQRRDTMISRASTVPPPHRPPSDAEAGKHGRQINAASALLERVKQVLERCPPVRRASVSSSVQRQPASQCNSPGTVFANNTNPCGIEQGQNDGTVPICLNKAEGLPDADEPAALALHHSHHPECAAPYDNLPGDPGYSEVAKGCEADKKRVYFPRAHEQDDNCNDASCSVLVDNSKQRTSGICSNFGVYCSDSSDLIDSDDHEDYYDEINCGDEDTWWFFSYFWSGPPIVITSPSFVPPLDLSGLYIPDDVAALQKYRIPMPTPLPIARLPFTSREDDTNKIAESVVQVDKVERLSVVKRAGTVGTVPPHSCGNNSCPSTRTPVLSRTFHTNSLPTDTGIPRGTGVKLVLLEASERRCRRVISQGEVAAWQALLLHERHS